MAAKRSLDIVDQAVELIRLCACVLRPDIKEALIQARDREPDGSMGRGVIDTILENASIAAGKNSPMCQDTGMVSFWVDHPASASQSEVREQLVKAVTKATKLSYLRPNTIEALSGKNPGDNSGEGTPIFHFHAWKRPELRVGLMLKGGGSENVSAQYKLPDIPLKAGRDLDGVRRCVLDTVFKAQGEGCAPGIIGVCIGGARDSAYEAAKRGLFRGFKERNKDPELAIFEEAVLKDINTLGIGPMGLGGRTTALGVKVTTLARHPATYYVTIAYTCWALRSYSMTIKLDRAGRPRGGARYD